MALMNTEDRFVAFFRDVEDSWTLIAVVALTFNGCPCPNSGLVVLGKTMVLHRRTILADGYDGAVTDLANKLPILAHESAGVDCCGCVVVFIRGKDAERRCNGSRGGGQRGDCGIWWR